MSIASLWLPSLGPTATPAFTIAAFGTYDNSGFTSSTNINFSSMTGSISSYTTVSGDCVVIGYTTAGSNNITFSGCGATWFNENCGSSGPLNGINVGWGATAGGTAVTITTSAGAGALVVAVFRGVKSASSPLDSHAAGTGGSTSITTGNLTNTAGDLLLGCGGASSTGAWSSGTNSVWSNGQTNTLVALDNNQRAVRLDWVNGASGTTTTYTANATSSFTLQATAVSLLHA